MSDSSRGSGWWMASDGKWYAPHLHPDAQRVLSVAPGPSLPGLSTLGVPQPTMPPPGIFYGTQVGDASSSDLGERRRVRYFPSLAVALVVALVVAGGAVGFVLTRSSGSSIANDSPQQLISSMTAAIRTSGSVHVVTNTRQQGQTATWVNDTGTDSGEQIITSGSAKATALVVHGAAYFTANQQGMTTFFSAPPGVAAQAAGKWLSLVPSDPAATSVADTLTINTLLQEVMPPAQDIRSHLGSSTVDGQQVVGITANVQGASATLYVSATGPPLPVEEIGQKGSSTSTVQFSNWGEIVHPAAPSNAIPGSTFGF